MNDLHSMNCLRFYTTNCTLHFQRFFIVRSLGNKSAAVLDTIVHNSLDLFAAVGTWHDSHESPSVIASTPPGFQVFERARPRPKKKATCTGTNHGGICVFVRSCFKVHIVDFPTYNHSSCYLCLSIHVPCRSCSSSFTGQSLRQLSLTILLMCWSGLRRSPDVW